MAPNASARILIVDDEAAHMRALCDTLGGQNYATTGFSAPDTALAAIARGCFDLILTDLMMPGMDGIAFLAAARAKDPDLVGIIMTGEGTIATAVEAMKSGAIDYILKPFKLSRVLPVLERALSMRRLRLENAALELRIRERTTELEMANKELEAFSYSVSHDLRAPLRHVEGFIGILMRNHSSQFGPEAKRLLDVVTGETRRMNQLIDDLLRFARLGRQSLHKEEISLDQLFRLALEEVQKGAGDRKVEVRFGPLPTRQGDRPLLQQVALNLLSNAFKFTRERAVALIEIGSQAADGECVCFVRDNGAGFDMQYAQKLFGVFQRLHSQEQFEGTGVGLSLTQRIIARHGGRIWAEGATNQGATFYFTLPG